MSRGMAPSYRACSFCHLTMLIPFKHLASPPTVPAPSCIWPSCFSAPGSHASPQTPLCVRTWPHTFTSSQFATRCVLTLLEKCSTKCGETLEFLEKCSSCLILWIRKRTFNSSEAGCQAGGPLLVRRPIEVGEALMTPRCLDSK